MSRSWSVAFAFALAAGLAACSGNVSTEPPPPPIIGLPNGGQTLFLAGPGASSQVTVSEPGYNGIFTAASANTGVATITPAGGAATSVGRSPQAAGGDGSGTYTVTAAGNGSTTITIADQNGRSGSFTAVVSGFAPPSPSPSTISFTAAGQTQTVTVTEIGYSGTFSASSGNAGVTTVSPASGATTFTVSAVAAGSTTVTFTDANGTPGTLPVSVTISSGVISSHATRH